MYEYNWPINSVIKILILRYKKPKVQAKKHWLLLAEKCLLIIKKRHWPFFKTSQRFDRPSPHLGECVYLWQIVAATLLRFYYRQSYIITLRIAKDVHFFFFCFVFQPDNSGTCPLETRSDLAFENTMEHCRKFEIDNQRTHELEIPTAKWVTARESRLNGQK